MQAFRQGTLAVRVRTCGEKILEGKHGQSGQYRECERGMCAPSRTVCLKLKHILLYVFPKST